MKLHKDTFRKSQELKQLHKEQGNPINIRIDYELSQCSFGINHRFTLLLVPKLRLGTPIPYK